jgi:hypothetical protein
MDLPDWSCGFGEFVYIEAKGLSMRTTFFVLASIIIANLPAWAQVPYDNIPGWLSEYDGYYATGCAVDDVNGDGFPDLAVSNGNDILQAPNLIYFNQNGFMPDSAEWISSTILYSGHCDLGDYDSDGFPELAVANYRSANWGPELLDIYDNNAGIMEVYPSWRSNDSLWSFRLAWGDADNDGDLDLAVATGEAYHAQARPNLIYYNNNGVIQTSPGWMSADVDYSYDVKWVDIDLDGDLDLAFCESGGPIKIYKNYVDSIAAVAEIQTADNDNYNSFDFADIDGDDYPELAAAANTQLSGSGLFKLFDNVGGTLDSLPFWTSANAGYGSEAAFSDIDADGDFDLVCGRWWGLVYIYLNNNGSFPAYPDWNSSGTYNSVIENIVFSDFNRGGERHYRQAYYMPQTTLFHLPPRQIAGVDSVRTDGMSMDPDQYCFSLWDGWVSIAAPAADSVEVFYRFSRTQDMAVTNWDRETYIFYNTSLAFVPGDANDSGVLNGLDVVYLVAYLKGQGPAPEMRFQGDANGSCDVNGLDVIYLVNYFKGGVSPAAGDCD